MNLHLENKVVVVTGAAKGIGAATAKAFYDEGAFVALLDRSAQGRDVAGSLGERAAFWECDVSHGPSVQQAMAAAERHFGGLDLLVNNAGIQTYGSVTGTPEEEWEASLDVNVKSAFLCAKYAIPLMQRRGSGVIVNVASVQSFLSQNNVAAYTTGKTALLGLTRSIAVDYAPAIRCVAVCPGTVDTPMLHWAIRQSPDPQEVLEECRLMHLCERIGTPEEVAGLILFLASDRASFITGQAYRIDGGIGLKAGGGKR